jgi:hypothetical protein
MTSSPGTLTDRSLRIVLGLLALGLLAGGIGFGFAPERAAVNFAITTTGLAGLGTLRADLGGCFLALGLVTLAGLRPGHSSWLIAPLVFFAAFLALRLFHLAIDGVSFGGLRSATIEAIALALLYLGHHRWNTAG